MAKRFSTEPKKLNISILIVYLGGVKAVEREPDLQSQIKFTAATEVVRFAGACQ